MDTDLPRRARARRVDTVLMAGLSKKNSFAAVCVTPAQFLFFDNQP
jgi:hypothetical protein